MTEEQMEMLRLRLAAESPFEEYDAQRDYENWFFSPYRSGYRRRCLRLRAPRARAEDEVETECGCEECAGATASVNGVSRSESESE